MLLKDATKQLEKRGIRVQGKRDNDELNAILDEKINKIMKDKASLERRIAGLESSMPSSNGYRPTQKSPRNMMHMASQNTSNNNYNNSNNSNSNNSNNNSRSIQLDSELIDLNDEFKNIVVDNTLNLGRTCMDSGDCERIPINNLLNNDINNHINELINNLDINNNILIDKSSYSDNIDNLMLKIRDNIKLKNTDKIILEYELLEKKINLIKSVENTDDMNQYYNIYKELVLFFKKSK